MKALILTLVAALGLSLVALPGSARPGMMAGPESGERMERMIERLDLSEEQQSQVGDIMNSARTDAAADRERVRQIHQEMKSLVQNFDEGRAQELADELGQITARQTYQRTATQAQIYSLLTPEQREQMSSMREKRKERMSAWRDQRP